MTDWILAVEWTQIADIATAVVVVVLVLAEYKRTLPGFFSGLGEGHRRFLMLDAVLNVNILFVTGGRVRKGLFQLVDRLLRKACRSPSSSTPKATKSPQISE